MEIKLEKGAVQICRICLQNIEPDSPILYLNCAASQNSSVTIEDKLIECVPDLNLYAVPNAIICNECSIALNSAYSFKLKCRQTEMQINKYLQQINATTLFDLAEVQHMDVHNGSIKVEERVIPYLKMEMDDGSFNSSSVVEDNNFTVNTEEVLRDECYTNSDNTDTYYSCYMCEYTAETNSELSLHMQTHADIEESTTSGISSLLPQKSRSKYEKVYDRFLIWCDEKKVISNAKEKDFLAYFEHLSKNYKPSSLWAFYSMLRTMMSMKENKDISKYSQLITFLKRQNKGYRPKKAKVLSMADIGKFLKEADDQTFLLVKVATIIGIAGACRMDELTNLLLENVKNQGQVLQIQIPSTKTKIRRQFFVTSGGIEGLNMVEIVRKYLKQRPLHTDHGRFFVGYRKGSCIKQPVGINTFGSMPKKIASFLNLTNPSEYTGHCFRRLSTSLVSVSGADFLTVKHHGGWKSSTVAEVYIDTSNENKKKVAEKILDYPT